LKGDTLVLDDGSTHSATALFNSQADPRTRAAFFPYGLTDTFALAYVDFLSAIDGEREPEMSGTEGLFDLERRVCHLRVGDARPLGQHRRRTRRQRRRLPGRDRPPLRLM